MTSNVGNDDSLNLYHELKEVEVDGAKVPVSADIGFPTHYVGFGILEGKVLEGAEGNCLRVSTRYSSGTNSFRFYIHETHGIVYLSTAPNMPNEEIYARDAATKAEIKPFEGELGRKIADVTRRFLDIQARSLDLPATVGFSFEGSDYWYDTVGHCETILVRRKHSNKNIIGRLDAILQEKSVEELTDADLASLKALQNEFGYPFFTDEALKRYPRINAKLR